MGRFEKVQQSKIVTATTLYEVNKVNGDKETAYMWAGELMALKGIGPNDAIVRELKREHVPMFDRDYRRGVDFTPKWVYGEVPSRMSVETSTSSYDLYRDDTASNGCVKVHSRDVKLEITEVKSPGYSNRLNDMIKLMDRECDRAETKMDISFMHGRGEMAVHRISAESSYNLQASEFGFILTTRPSEKDSIRSVVMLHRENLKKSHINVSTATKVIMSQFERELKRMNPGCKIKIVSIDNLYKQKNK